MMCSTLYITAHRLYVSVRKYIAWNLIYGKLSLSWAQEIFAINFPIFLHNFQFSEVFKNFHIINHKTWFLKFAKMFKFIILQQL
jgi:hypothetical protein